MESVVEVIYKDKNEIIRFITGGKIRKWTPDVHASRLTSLSSVLHKICVHNWLPTTNDSVVTFDQALLLYKLGKGHNVNFGNLVFNHVAGLVEKKGTCILPFPTLIFNLLVHQGFEAEEDDVFCKAPELFTVNPAMLKGNRVIDLPCRFRGCATNVEDISDHHETILDYRFLPLLCYLKL